MTNQLDKTTVRVAMNAMSARTLASFIADLDMLPSDEVDNNTFLMGMALDALFAIAGEDAIHMLSEMDVTATNPLVEAAVEEWLIAA